MAYIQEAKIRKNAISLRISNPKDNMGPLIFEERQIQAECFFCQIHCKYFQLNKPQKTMGWKKDVNFFVDRSKMCILAVHKKCFQQIVDNFKHYKIKRL